MTLQRVNAQHVAKCSVSICICKATFEQRDLFSICLHVFYFNSVFAKGLVQSVVEVSSFTRNT